ncbi:glycosyltransferase family A protein [Croceibacterium sp. TMG7-5b_MA50]|uniref:glycosyltransferase family 2 protein n=1 Tax=Croceibacterium sp. TMG7-5b_MA50 TaxID=3121290 RepID=UPI0032218442
MDPQIRFTHWPGPLPHVTVVIPAWNMARYLARSVASALAQTWPALDVLVVDDGSTDDTLALAEAIAAREPRVTVRSFPNGGVARARNRGTEAARGTYVAYLDADDLWHPTKIEKQMAALRSHADDDGWVGCYALFRMVDDGDRVLASGYGAGKRGSFFFDHLLVNHVGNGSSLLVLREAALAVDGFDPSYAEAGIGGSEDFDFQLRLLMRYKLEYVPEYLVGYRLHAAQMSADQTRMALGHIAVVERFVHLAQLDGRQAQFALVAANRAAAIAMARSGDWRNAARAARQLWSDDRSAAVGFAAERLRFGAKRALARLGHSWGSHARLSPRSWHFAECDPLPGILPDGRQARPGSPLYPAPLDTLQGPLAEDEAVEDAIAASPDPVESEWRTRQDSNL